MILKTQSVSFEKATILVGLRPSVSVKNVVVDNNRCILRSVKILEGRKKRASYFRGEQKAKSAMQRYSEHLNKATSFTIVVRASSIWQQTSQIFTKFSMIITFITNIEQ